MRDIKIEVLEDQGHKYQDIVIGDDLNFTDEREELIQHLFIKLQFIYGEWFLGRFSGVRYFEVVWKKRPNLLQIDREFKRVILNTEGVQNLVRYRSELDVVNRKYSVNFTANTIYGTVVFNRDLIMEA